MGARLATPRPLSGLWQRSLVFGDRTDLILQALAVYVWFYVTNKDFFLLKHEIILEQDGSV